MENERDDGKGKKERATPESFDKEERSQDSIYNENLKRYLIFEFGDTLGTNMYKNKKKP